MVRSTTKSTKTKGKGPDGTTARIELSVSRVVIQSPRSTSKTTKTTKAKPTAKTSKPTGKKRTK